MKKLLAGIIFLGSMSSFAVTEENWSAYKLNSEKNEIVKVGSLIFKDKHNAYLILNWEENKQNCTILSKEESLKRFKQPEPILEVDLMAICKNIEGDLKVISLEKVKENKMHGIEPYAARSYPFYFVKD